MSEFRREGGPAEFATSYRDLRVYRAAFDAAMQLRTLARTFPEEERYLLVSQVSRSSRSVCANLAEAWRKRRYRQAFVAKLSDAESEAAETQVWVEFAQACGYLAPAVAEQLHSDYDRIIAQLVTMIEGADRWVIKPRP